MLKVQNRQQFVGGNADVLFHLVRLVDIVILILWKLTRE